MLDFPSNVEHSEEAQKIPDFSYWFCVRKYTFVGKMALFCATAPCPMASYIPLKEQELQMQENEKIAILFCHFVWLF